MIVFLSLIKLAFIKFMRQKLNREKFSVPLSRNCRRRQSSLLLSVDMAVNGAVTESTGGVTLSQTTPFEFETPPQRRRFEMGRG
ncbi:unnamed protein product [Gongylonema pulchrum]|uniref:Uncharacterized protein n=1 Tax=Gongylonema pulchrum TaxID=637853 RepID=A0A183EZ48_9BILA|nr:unnamed protein product [Gongylonema pulchrum]